jgi:hypothetical protein
MSQVYTPGLQISPTAAIEKVRELPLLGRALVKVGDRVEATTPVLEAELPGELEVVRIADIVGAAPEDIEACLTVRIGERVQRGALLYEKKAFFGLFTDQVRSPAPGTVEFFLSANGHLGIRRDSTPLQVNGYIAGVVSEVVEGKSVTIQTTGALLQGIFGVGGERLGTVYALPLPPTTIVTAAELQALGVPLRDHIVIGGMTFDETALNECAAQGVSAVITGSLSSEVLTRFVGYEIGVSITGDEPVPFSLIITEGFGSLPLSSRAMELARRVHGLSASLSGQTQVRAGALRPELIVSQFTLPQTETTTELPKTLEPNARIRCIRVPYFGALGTITTLPHEPAKLPTGAEVRVLRARLDTGEEITIPRANVELIS